MDEYRPTLLGRSLADVLQAMELDGALLEEESNALFVIFDDVMRSEFAAAEPRKSEGKEASDEPPPPLYTHGSMEIHGVARSFNRYMDKWTIHAALDTAKADSIRLDGVPVDLAMDHVPQAEIMVKLHDIPRQHSRKRK